MGRLLWPYAHKIKKTHRGQWYRLGIAPKNPPHQDSAVGLRRYASASPIAFAIDTRTVNPPYTTQTCIADQINEQLVLLCITN